MGFSRRHERNEAEREQTTALPTGWYGPGIIKQHDLDILYPDGPLPPMVWPGGNEDEPIPPEVVELLERHLQETRAEIAQRNGSTES